MTPFLLSKLALEEDKGEKKGEWTKVSEDSIYHFVIHPSLALECINSLVSLGYSIHATENPAKTAIAITVKNRGREKQTVNISNKARELISNYIM